MAIIITPPLTKPSNVQTTLQDGGSLLANTTYYVRMTYRSCYQWYGWSDAYGLGAPVASPVSDEISFTTTTTKKSALITWDAPVETVAGKNIYCSDVSGNYYIKHCGGDANSTVGDGTTNQYLITTVGAGNGMDAFSSLSPTQYLPLKISKEIGSLQVNIVGTYNLQDIYNAIVAAGYSDYVYYDGKIFALRGGFNCTGTAPGSFYMTQSIIYLFQGGLRNQNPNMHIQFGTLYNGYTGEGCIICQTYESPIWADNVYFYDSYLTGNFHNGGLYGYMNGGALSNPLLLTNRDIKNLTLSGVGFGWTGYPLKNLNLNTAGSAYWIGESQNVNMSSGSLYITVDMFEWSNGVYYGHPHLRNWNHNITESYAYHFNVDVYPAGGRVWGFTTDLYDCNYTVKDVPTSNNLPIVYYSGLTEREFRIFNSFSLKVTDSSGNTINGSTVLLLNKDSSVMLNTTTDSNGLIVTSDIQRAKINWAGTGTSSVTTLFNPFTLTISKDGYQTYTDTFDITEKIDWEITLLEEIPPVYYQAGINAIVTENSLSGTLTSKKIIGGIIP